MLHEKMHETGCRKDEDSQYLLLDCDTKNEFEIGSEVRRVLGMSVRCIGVSTRVFPMSALSC